MEMVILKTFDNYFTANIWLTRLQDAGIPCFLLDEHTVTIDPILTNAIGGIKLAVGTDHETLARQALLEMENDYGKSLVCPKCGADNLVPVPKKSAKNMLTAVLTWLFSSFAISAEQVYACPQCGYETENPPGRAATS